MYPMAMGSLSKSPPTIGMLVVAFLAAAPPSGVCCVNDVHFAPNNITRSLLHQLWFEVGKAVFDREVFALLKARFSKTLPEGGN